MIKGKDISKKPRVLIVDDEEDFRLTLKDILEVKGYETVTVENGKNALQEVNRDSFDIGLIDLNLPDVSGLELIQTIKLYSPETELIVLTGSPSLPTAVKALNAGAFGYIEKPYNVDRLFIVLERAFERQRLIRVLRESETRYRRLFEEVGSAILLLNLKTNEIYHPNKAFTKLFGYHEADLPVLSFRDFFTSEDYTRLEQNIQKLNQDEKVTLETKLRRKGGTPFWAEMHLTLIRNPYLLNHISNNGQSTKPNDSEPIALVLIMDLTKRKEAEIDLINTKSYLEAIFTGIGSGIAIIDSNYTILDANPAYCRFYGYPIKEIIGKKCYEIHHQRRMPCNNLGEVCPVQRCRIMGTYTQVNHEHSPQNSGVRYLEIAVTPLKDKNGNLTSFIMVQNDLTEIRKTNKQLELKSKELETLNLEISAQKNQLQATTEQLQSANVELTKMSQAKSEFVSTVSHEMRTPLTAIMEGVNLVGDGSLGNINPEQKTFLTLVRNNAKRLTNLIDNLLDLSKIEAKRFEIMPTKIDLGKTIRELTHSVGPLVREKELTLKLALATDLPSVLADEPSVFRVIMNLVSNAVKYSAKGGTITIYAEPHLSQPSESATDNLISNSVVVSVADTGIGIPKKQQYKLFNKFQQIIREGQPRKSGTGLGLALSREIVELNQGQIWAESEEGKGSKFSFSLPIYNEYEDLKKTFDIVFKNCQDASVPIVIHWFKALEKSVSLRSDQRNKILDKMEKIVKSRVAKSDVVRRLDQENSIVIISAVLENNPKKIDVQIQNSLQDLTFLVNNKKLDMKFNGIYCVFETKEIISFEKVLVACQTKLEEVRKCVRVDV
jgi:PAS domain S-box-containing protein